MLSIPAHTTAGTPGKTLGCTLKMLTVACQIAMRATSGARKAAVPDNRPMPAEAVRAKDVMRLPASARRASHAILQKRIPRHNPIGSEKVRGRKAQSVDKR